MGINNYIAENLFIIGSSKLCWNISTLNKDGPDNCRFQKIKLFIAHNNSLFLEICNYRFRLQNHNLFRLRTIARHFTTMRTSCYDTDLALQMKLTKFIASMAKLYSLLLEYFSL